MEVEDRVVHWSFDYCKPRSGVELSFKCHSMCVCPVHLTTKPVVQSSAVQLLFVEASFHSYPSLSISTPTSTNGTPFFCLTFVLDMRKGLDISLVTESMKPSFSPIRVFIRDTSSHFFDRGTRGSLC